MNTVKVVPRSILDVTVSNDGVPYHKTMFSVRDAPIDLGVGVLSVRFPRSKKDSPLAPPLVFEARYVSAEDRPRALEDLCEQVARRMTEVVNTLMKPPATEPGTVVQ